MFLIFKLYQISLDKMKDVIDLHPLTAGPTGRSPCLALGSSIQVEYGSLCLGSSLQVEYGSLCLGSSLQVEYGSLCLGSSLHVEYGSC